MLETPLRTLSVLLSAFVLLGFSLFAIDETRAASEQSKAQIEGKAAATYAAPERPRERARDRAHGGLREFVDDVNDVALTPFAPLTDGSDTAWVRRGIPALLALFAYGFGLAMLARFSRGVA